MTEISFHFNAPSRAGYACRLLRQAQRHGMAIAVTGPPAVLDELDRELWTLAPADFVAHQRIERMSEVPADLHPSTIWLGDSVLDAPVHDALVNLFDAPPPGFETFGRLFEVVSTDEADRQAARDRWKVYQRRGYSIKRHEVAA